MKPSDPYQLARQLSEDPNFMRLVLDQLPNQVFWKDRTLTYIGCNKAFANVVGLEDPSEVTGKTDFDFNRDPAMAEYYRADDSAVMVTGKPIYNRVEAYDTADGKKGSVSTSKIPIKKENGDVVGILGVCIDITVEEQTKLELDYLAHHDTLTGLANRTLLKEIANKSIVDAERKNKHIAILFIDLDRFKNINDIFGHNTGDELIVHVANKLNSTLRKEDFIARLGGDEFVLFINDVEQTASVARVAEKIMQTLKAPVMLAGHEMTIGASVGISLYPDDGTGIDELLKHADTAMYQAKRRGRNNFQFYSPSLTEESLKKLLLENDLRNAIENNELRLHYQPQVTINDGKIESCEALIRWQHPKYGLLLPAEFIPLAAETGLIVDIGQWVLNTACNDMQYMLNSGASILRVAVNVAAIQLKRGNLVEDVQMALESSGLNPAHLELEITEDFIMQEAQSAIETLNNLRELGVVLSIDDFGTGYSSLNYLKHLPIDKLKIDKSFIQDIPHEPDDMAITKAIIAMGSSLHINVIAEGVETKAQAQFLSKEGCDHAQGFLYSKPVSLKTLLRIVQLEQK